MTLQETRQEVLDAVNIEWVKIREGHFIMGSPKEEANRELDEIQHTVYLSSFWISKYPITFQQYDDYCDLLKKKKPNDAGWGRGSLPVINVSWDEAYAFAKFLGCRLPTEAEWEYVCRAGTQTAFSYGENLLPELANYNQNPSLKNTNSSLFKSKTSVVGTYPANNWGVHDMHGNVWEWCMDWYADYSLEVQRNPTGPVEGTHRVRRGGNWRSKQSKCRSANRSILSPDLCDSTLGFRIVKKM